MAELPRAELMHFTTNPSIGRGFQSSALDERCHLIFMKGKFLVSEGYNFRYSVVVPSHGRDDEIHYSLKTLDWTNMLERSQGDREVQDTRQSIG